MTCTKEFSIEIDPAGFDCQGAPTTLSGLSWDYQTTAASGYASATSMSGAGASGAFTGHYASSPTYPPSPTSGSSSDQITATFCNPTASQITLRLSFSGTMTVSAYCSIYGSGTFLDASVTSYGGSPGDISSYSCNCCVTNSPAIVPYVDFVIPAMSIGTIGFSVATQSSLALFLPESPPPNVEFDISGTFSVSIVP